ncbi:Ig-like domain-containing domain [Emticicia sp. SJ17W-69]|uniref:Ig-like domain-containing protein n=1 Tax=Emticicia sp. SJ17W-69 TaxID=3421657 RepID=UPI003EBA3EA0
MNKNTIKKNFTILTTYILCISCAQFVPPTGGKKDEIAPKLVKSNPPNEQKNYKGKDFELVFDELIDATSLRQELLIVPEPEGTYNVKQKSNSLILKFDKPFKDSTTYTFNFRKGIKDLNERNESRNLKIVFSTGSNIDSLKLEGNVKSLLTNQPILDAHVAIYRVQDSLDLKKTKPNYFLKTDSSGNFKFENIKAGNYRIYAFTDKNNNLKYDSKTESIAIVKDTIKLYKNIKDIKLLLFPANNEKPKNQKTLQRAEDFTVLYDKNIKSFDVRFDNIKDSIPYFGEGKELKFYNFPQKTDTIKVNITVQDSANNILTHIQKIKFRDPEKRRKITKEYQSFQTKPKMGEDVEQDIKYVISFNNPISQFDIKKIKVVSDTIKVESVDESNFNWNKYKTVLTINKKVTALREVKIEFQNGAFINVKGDSSEKYILKNQILKEENYGIIEGKIEGEKNENKIIQLIDETYKVEAEEKSNEKYLFKNVKPGIYLIRIIIDSNANGQWDFGNVEKDILPETIYFSKEPIKIKSNFELRGINIKLE